MRFKCASLLLGLTLLLYCSSRAQDKAGREIDIHKNVRLIEAAIPQEMPEEFKSKYRDFLPLFEEALRENTSEQALENALTFRIVPGIKEVGAAKTKRAFASISAYRRNSKSEFVGSILLHSYTTGQIVSKEEIGEFLQKQILHPLGVS